MFGGTLRQLPAEDAPSESRSASTRSRDALSKKRLSFLALEGGIEGSAARSEVVGFDVPAGLGGAVHAIHANVFPLDRERPAITDIVERNDDLFELNVAVPDGPKIPIAAMITEIGVTAKDADISVAVPPPNVLHVSVVNAVLEVPEELYVVNALVSEVRRIVVKTKAIVMLHRLKRAMSRADIKRDFSGMHFKSKVHVRAFKGFQNRQKAPAKIVVSFLQIVLTRRRKRIAGVPDG